MTFITSVVFPDCLGPVTIIAFPEKNLPDICCSMDLEIIVFVLNPGTNITTNPVKS
jgi:hypothetical protein